MSYEVISSEFEALVELEKKLMDGTIENKRDFWKKVTDINQKLSHATNLKETDYEKFKEQLEGVIVQVKEFQVEKERYYIALKEQIAYNKAQFEKEVTALKEKVAELIAAEDDELTSNVFHSAVAKFILRIKTVRPFDKTVRAEMVDEVSKILADIEIKRSANKEERVAESEEFKSALFEKIDTEYAQLKAAAETEIQIVYDKFFNVMEVLKNDLSSEKMIKKHVDQAWKHWKNVKEEAKTYFSEIQKKFHDTVVADLDAFIAKLPEISNPKEAFDQYKRIQNSAIKAPMKRRQKDKIFKQFKALWTQLQEKFDSHYKELEAQKAAREAEKQKHAEQQVKRKMSEAQEIEGELKELEETVQRLKSEIKNSQSQTFVRKANEVLAINENQLFELKRRYDRLRKDAQRVSA